MRIKCLLVIATAFIAPMLSGQQNVSRVFHATSIEMGRNIEQAASVIRTTTEIRQFTTNPDEKTISISGTAGQIALAEWLFAEFDRPSSTQAKHEYKVSETADDVVRIFNLSNAQTPANVGEAGTAAALTAGILHAFTYNPLKAVVMRGKTDQINVAEFLLTAMDRVDVVQPSSEKWSASPEYRLAEPEDTLVRVFYLPSIRTFSNFQELFTMARTVSNVRWMFTHSGPRAIAVRGSGEQIALIAWLFREIEAGSQAKRPESREFPIPSSSDEVVRLIFLERGDTPQRLQEMFAKVRAATKSPHTYMYSGANVILIRGTAALAAQAEQVVREGIIAVPATLAAPTTPVQPEVSRAFHFTSVDSVQNLNEVATTIRSIADIPMVATNTSQNTLTFTGTTNQIALGEWLSAQFDKSPSSQDLQNLGGAKHQYHVSDSSDDVVRVFYLTNPQDAQHMAEVGTVVRSSVNSKRVFLYSALKAIAVRGTAEQVNLAEFLVRELDKPDVGQAPMPANSVSPQYVIGSEPRENLVRVFFLPTKKTVATFQEVATLARNISAVRYSFTYNGPRAVVIRGNEEQLAVTAWLFKELEADPALREAGESKPAALEYQLSSSSGKGAVDIVRIFRLQHMDNAEQLQRLPAKIYNAMDRRGMRAFTYSVPNAVVVRGSAEQIALADRTISELDK